MNIVLKRSLMALALYIPTALQAQTNTFRLTGEFKNAVPHAKVYLGVDLNDDNIKVDSAEIINGRFVINGKVGNPTYALLYINQTTDGKKFDQGKIFIEPGDIVIKSDGLIADATFPGSKINEEFREVQVFGKMIEKGMDSINAHYSSEAARQVFYGKQREQERQFATAYIAAHPDSYFSLMYLQQLLESNAITATAAKAMYEKFGEKYKGTQKAKVLKANIEGGLSVDFGTTAPDFTAHDANGLPVKLSSFKGKYVLLEFWASWCAPCRAESPYLLAAYKKYKDAGFTILSLSLDTKGSKEKWLKAIETDGTGIWQHVCELGIDKDPTARLYMVPHLPFNVLIDPLGKIVAKELRGDALGTTLAKLL